METSVTLAGLQSLVKGKLDRVEALLQERLGTDVEIIERAAAQVGGSGGKRIRPLLLLLSAGLCGYEGDDDVLYAGVVEYIHTATLIHDDVIDEAEIRRGRATLNARYGNTMTVLIGDYIYTKSMDLALDRRDPAVLKILTERVLHMVEGQILEDRRRGDLETTEADALEINRRKTAYLFGACCRVAAHVAGVGVEAAEAIERYGLEMGMAFQLVDDLLDYVSDERTLGKPVLNDLREKRLTVPGIYLRDSGDDARALLASVLESDTIEESHRKQILGMAREREVLTRTRELARSYAEAAPAHLDSFPDGPYRQTLQALPQYVLARSR